MKLFTKEGELEDYNLVCPDCGNVYYERPRRTEEIIKGELYFYGRVREGHEPCFIPACSKCGKSGYKHFTSGDLKPRNKKEAGKIIKVTKGDLGPCYQKFTHISLDWGFFEKDDVEKKKLIGGIKTLKDSYRAFQGVHIYANFPEYNTAIHFTVRKDNILETVKVFGRVSQSDAENFVKDLLYEVDKAEQQK